MSFRAQLVPLDLTVKQKRYMARAAGTARVAYNWALSEWKRQASEWWTSGKATPYPSAFGLQKQCNLERMAANWAVSARGDGSSARKRKLKLRSLSVKREAQEEVHN